MASSISAMESSEHAILTVPLKSIAFFQLSRYDFPNQSIGQQHDALESSIEVVGTMFHW